MSQVIVESVLGSLVAKNTFPVDLPQRDAWLVEIEILKRELGGLDGALFLEFDVPRVGSRDRAEPAIR